MTSSQQLHDGTSTDVLAGQVLVGVDGSPGSEHALRWAIDKAEQLGPVVPAISFQVPTTFDAMGRIPTLPDPSLYRKAAEATLADALAGLDPELRQQALVVESYPGTGLVSLAAGAELLVVGSRGRGRVTAALLGSVGSYCVKHATVPVVIVPDDHPATGPLATIVVGVDGSTNAEAALRWAIDHAGPDTRIVALGAFSVRAYADAGLDPPLPLIEEKLRGTVQKSVSNVTGSDYDGPEIEIRVDSRDPRAALRHVAGQEGDLLVVGARGVIGLAHLIVGSVASALVNHPNVATVVVPAP